MSKNLLVGAWRLISFEFRKEEMTTTKGHQPFCRESHRPQQEGTEQKCHSEMTENRLQLKMPPIKLDEAMVVGYC